LSFDASANLANSDLSYKSCIEAIIYFSFVYYKYVL
jgi:hypothetical protein